MNELGHNQEAIKNYDIAIKYKPDFAVAYHAKGNALKNLEKLLEAIENYDQAILYRPNYADHYNSKGIALNELGRHQEAMESYNLAIKYDSDNVYAYQLANELAKKIKKSNLRIITD
ncbi:TPR repeat-containing protein 08 [Orientia tsutsugamushi]|uniref:TPR repeat-containing protein 08 n=1 Tax=Orientia tsutsugamushi TaxID=784 RepID=A0A2U3RFS2_ORITS|nr:TPR repeat family protein [Orientia tsutsugamushi str. UT76]SPR12008.1 TPR repeat-containing protein 08 [Orientia tsutsugamushi]